MGNDQGGNMTNEDRRLIVETLGEMYLKSASMRILSMEFLLCKNSSYYIDYSGIHAA